MPINDYGMDDEELVTEDPDLSEDPNAGMPSNGEALGMEPMMDPLQPSDPNRLTPIQLGHQSLENITGDIEDLSDGQDLSEELSIIDPRNYALSENVVTRFREDILDNLDSIEDQRSPLESLWSECEDIWARQNNDQSRYYTGINDAYMPTGFRALETHIQHVMSQLFPFQFMCVPKQMNPMSMMLAQQFTGILEHDAEQAKVELLTENALRQSLIYGWVPLYTGWKEVRKRNYQIQLDPRTNKIVAAAGIKPIKTYCGPTFQIVDPYDIYFHPFDAMTPKECECIHQYIRTDIRKIRKMDAKLTGNARLPFIGTENIKEGRNEKDLNRQGEQKKNIRLEKYGFRRDQIENKYEKIALRVWCKFDLYNSGDLVDCKATIVDEQIVELRQNPHVTQEAPYDSWSPFNTSRHIYKMGMCEIMRVLVYILNAIINQMLDANLFQTNMMMAINTDRYQGRPGDLEITPFNVFAFDGVGPVKDNIQFMKPELNIQQSLMSANLIASTIQDSVAASAAIQGKFSSKERTKGEVDTVTAAAMTGVSAMVRSFAHNFLGQWLRNCIDLEQQFRSPEDEFNILGMPVFKMPLEMRAQKYHVKILTTPEVQQMQMAQAAMQAAQTDSTATGGSRNGDSNPEGINNPGGNNPESMGANTFGSDGGVG